MQLVFLSFKKKIYKDGAGLEDQLIEAGDVVQVRLRTGCNSCSTSIDCDLPNVPAEAIGCDPRATLEANSQYVLDSQDPIPCVGEVVPITVEEVTCDGRGFTFDRMLDGQNFRGSDIDMVMPDHDGVGCLGIVEAPSALAATAIDDSSISLTWTDNSDDETSFEVQRSLDGVTGWTTVLTPAADATSDTDTGLTASTQYFYRIRAIRAGDGSTSAWSNIDDATTTA